MAAVYNALSDARTVVPIEPTSRKRCGCGCKKRATHKGLADNCCMVEGCELSMMRWKRSPIEAERALRRITQQENTNE